MAPRFSPRKELEQTWVYLLAGDGKHAGLSLLQLPVFAVDIEERAIGFGPEFDPDDFGEKDRVGLVVHDLAHFAIEADEGVYQGRSARDDLAPFPVLKALFAIDGAGKAAGDGLV